MFKILITYFRVLFAVGKDNDFHIAKLHLNNKSFRFTEKDAKDNLLLLRTVKRLFFKVVVKRKKYDAIDSNIVLFEARETDKRLMIDYIKFFVKDEDVSFITLEKLFTYTTFFNKIVLLLTLVNLSIIFQILQLFHNNKYYYPLLLTQILESFILLNILKKNNINKIYYSNIYENNSNVNYLLLKRSNIFCVKITSQFPLAFFNKNLLTDKLILSNYYQKEEIKYFKNIKYKEANFWAPIKFLETNQININGLISSAKNKIAFYSSGHWHRKRNNERDMGINAYENEQKLLLMLKSIIYENNKLELNIYLHPREKKEISLSISYYNQLLKGLKYNIIETEKDSAYYFNECELGVSLLSSTVYERIYFGFKTLFVSKDIDGFPIKGTGLYNIAINDFDDLKKRVLGSLKQTNEAFFKINNLTEYKYN